MKVTVLMSVFNSEKYLSEAIESILNQTYKDFDFLIFDDGSTDKSREILEEYAEKDKRIKLIINKENLGLTKTLNVGIRESKGEYIARMDADDVSEPERLENQVDFMESHPEVGVCGSWMKSFGEEEIEYRLPIDSNYIKALMLFRNTLVHSSVMMRKAVLVDNKLEYNEKYRTAQDYDLWTRMSRYCQITNLESNLVKYRVHGKQIGKTSNGNQKITIVDVHRRQLEELGIKVSEEELKLHEIIVGQKFNPQQNLINEIEEWLLKIINTNKDKKIYDDNALKKVLYDEWFFVCYNSIVLGRWVLDKFLKSELFLDKEFDLSHRILFRLRIIKHETYLKYSDVCSKLVGMYEKSINRLGFGFKLKKEVKKRYKIGMAVLAYNRPEYLEICLDSLFETNLYDYNITFLLQDDGSDDPKVKEIINKERDSKYKVVRSFTKKGHNSWGAAFNKAVKKLMEIDDFDIIGTSDSDAFYHPEWLDKTMKTCLWAKKHHKDHTLGPFSSFNSSDYVFHRVLGEYQSPFGEYVVKERMGALNYFYFKEDLLKLGLFSESKDDETLMTDKFKKFKVRNFCTKVSYIEHIGKYSILNEWRPIPVKDAVYALNLINKGWNKCLSDKYSWILKENK